MALQALCSEGGSIVIAFTDGSSIGNPGPGGWACQIDRVLSFGSVPCATNNAMELFAIYKVVEQVPAESQVTIITDSKLCIGWLDLGWKCNNPINASIRQAYFAAVGAKRLDVTFEKIKAHVGHAGNEDVNKAALEAARNQKYNPQQAV